MATSMREEIKVGELARSLPGRGRAVGRVGRDLRVRRPGRREGRRRTQPRRLQETIYGLEGVLTWTIEGTPTDVAAGEAVFIPRGAVHHFDNTQDVDAKALAS